MVEVLILGKPAGNQIGLGFFEKSTTSSTVIVSARIMKGETSNLPSKANPVVPKQTTNGRQPYKKVKKVHKIVKPLPIQPINYTYCHRDGHT